MYPNFDKDIASELSSVLLGCFKVIPVIIHRLSVLVRFLFLKSTDSIQGLMETETPVDKFDKCLIQYSKINPHKGSFLLNLKGPVPVEIEIILRRKNCCPVIIFSILKK